MIWFNWWSECDKFGYISKTQNSCMISDLQLTSITSKKSSILELLNLIRLISLLLTNSPVCVWFSSFTKYFFVILSGQWREVVVKMEKEEKSCWYFKCNDRDDGRSGATHFGSFNFLDDEGKINTSLAMFYDGK